MYALTAEQLEQWGYKYHRTFPDGLQIGLLTNYGRNVRMHFGLGPISPDNNYCYASVEAAVKAMNEFDPATMQEPTGWIKHIETNRCRVDGTPESESIGWPKNYSRDHSIGAGE
jgi:hypothetical protein